MIVHRGAELTAPAERITMVNAYVSLDRSRADQNRSRDLITVDDHGVLWTEWSRHVAWRAAGRLDELVHGMPFTSDPEVAVEALEAAIADVTQAIEDMRGGEVPMHHYE